MELVPATGFAAMLRRPHGRYAVERCSLYWCVDRRLTGCAVWGRPGEADLARLVSLFDLGDHRYIDRDCDFVADARGLQGIDTNDFGTFESSLLTRVDAIRARVGRQALVRPESGLVATLVEGFYRALGLSNFAVFTELALAFAWLGRPLVAASIAALTDQVRSAGLQARLRARITAQDFRITLPQAAAALAMSERSLQRELTEVGSSFRAEVNAARLGAAETLLVDTDLKLELVARRLGLHSAAHFTTWFRRQHGTSPRHWRESRRRVT